MKAYRLYFTVITGDCKVVGIFSNKVNALTFINEFQHNFTSELRIDEIYSDLFPTKGGS